jgi:hypothetical protein
MQSIEVKEMPFQEKYEATLDSIESYKSFVPGFVRERLGDEAEVELRRRWREGIEPVSEDAPAEERYESAYRNFISMARTNFAFVREYMDEDGMSEYVEAEVEALKRHNAGFSVMMLNLIRVISKSTAFKMLVNQSTYDLQWMTPSEMIELSPERAVIAIPSCKILDYPDTDDICYIGCQQAFPQWVAEQFKAEMSFDRQGKCCTCTLKPLA